MSSHPTIRPLDAMGPVRTSSRSPLRGSGPCRLSARGFEDPQLGSAVPTVGSLPEVARLLRWGPFRGGGRAACWGGGGSALGGGSAHTFQEWAFASNQRLSVGGSALGSEPGRGARGAAARSPRDSAVAVSATVGLNSETPDSPPGSRAGRLPRPDGCRGWSTRPSFSPGSAFLPGTLGLQGPLEGLEGRGPGGQRPPLGLWWPRRGGWGAPWVRAAEPAVSCAADLVGKNSMAEVSFTSPAASGVGESVWTSILGAHRAFGSLLSVWGAWWWWGTSERCRGGVRGVLRDERSGVQV